VTVFHCRRCRPIPAVAGQHRVASAVVYRIDYAGKGITFSDGAVLP